MRVRINLKKVEITLQPQDVVVHYDLVLLTGKEERVVPAQPGKVQHLSDGTLALFEKAVAALSYDLSNALGIGGSPNDPLAEDLLDDPEVLDDPEQEEGL